MDTDKLHVDTTQNVAIDYEIASLGDRIIATLIDMLIIVGYYILAIFVFMKMVPSYITLIIMVLPVLFYPLLCEVFMNGQSFGKRTRAIKVIRIDGKQPTFGNYLMRWLLGLIEVNFYGLIAMITIAINGKGQRLGDIAAGTSVIKLKQRESISHTVFQNVDDSYVAVFPQAGNLTDKEAETIKKVLLLKDTDNYPELAAALAAKIKGILQIETSMQDEEFIEVLLKDFNKVHGRLQ